MAARAILGEWLGGSGGGWQDSGGVWPGIKMIEGRTAGPGDPEFGVSRGRLLPDHRIYGEAEVSPATRQQICDSFVLVHGGMAQNVGPILEMVTEKYLLRSRGGMGGPAGGHRRDAVDRGGPAPRRRARRSPRATTRNFFGPIQTIIPWASNHYTETLIEQVPRPLRRRPTGASSCSAASPAAAWGSSSIPPRKTEAQDYLQELMAATKRRLQDALPFAMEPVVYDFAINDQRHGGRAAGRRRRA